MGQEKPLRRTTDHWRAFFRREAFIIGLGFAALGVIATGIGVLANTNADMKAEFEQHNKRSDAAQLCLLDAAGTPIPNKTVPELLAERRRLYSACIAREAPGVKSPLQKEKHAP